MSTNVETVKKYLSNTPEDRRQRPYLFSKDGSAGLYTTDGEPVVTTGRQKLLEHAEWSLKSFPDWEWYNIRIIETADFNEVWAECDGRGTINYPMYGPSYYENHFLHAFKFEDGLIVEQREFMNPIKQFRALGIDIPRIDRGNIPKD
ncbi:phenazine biosynthesis protein [Corynebacterium ulcerans]|uniref:PhzA/PhzB family protein n=1 Tax=Corynebacterium ulcerans TaxID=65058 RepID=UPI0013034334|nr:PhzA/PhzB family protein [Corynebacterium ulcerans]MBL4943497.1 PhzA/PhzB family protein [Corynebacterium ulcerans]QGZ24703.1 phenazine biosynthesis protein [Corynebacterium ulcerans]QOE23416.1 phenazine biosynthesis protein [Corynebacterium ulcerans]